MYNLTSSYNSAVFILKLDNNGNFIGAKSLTGTNDIEIFSASLDAFGNIYTTGRFRDTIDFDSGPGTFYLYSTGNYDVFILKLNTNGNFIWAKNMGGANNDGAYSINTDASGNVYTTGYFQSSGDFDPNSGIVNLYSYGAYDIFITKLDANGNFIWANNIGGAGNDYGKFIFIDPSNTVYVTGNYSANVDFDFGPGTYSLISVGLTDIFMQKISQQTSTSENIEKSISLIIFPNPTSSSITIETEHKIEQVNIYNMLSELVQTEYQNKFSIENLSKGMYLIQIKTNKGVRGVLMAKD